MHRVCIHCNSYNRVIEHIWYKYGHLMKLDCGHDIFLNPTETLKELKIVEKEQPPKNLRSLLHKLYIWLFSWGFINAT